MGPIKIISTYYEGQYKQDHFEERRKQFPNQIRMKTMYLTLNEDQFAQINGTYEEEYIQELADHMMKYVDLSIIEEANDDLDKIHQEMLEHERDVKHAQINHPADQSFLIEQNAKETIKQSEKAYFQYSNQTRQWQRVQDNQITPPSYLVAIALHKLARNPISEEEFHELTNFEYAKQKKQTSSEPEGYQNHWNHKPYFYHQNNVWYYVDQQEYAHPIKDERLLVLNKIKQQEISEDNFHSVTKNQYQEYLGLAYLPKEIIIDDKFRVTCAKELEQAIYKFSSEIFSFCSLNKIVDDKTLKVLSLILIKMKYFRI